MANIKSKAKRRLQDDKKYLRNKALKSQIKTAIKKAQETKAAKDINATIKLIDKAVTSGVFHKNKAARLKSRVHTIK